MTYQEAAQAALDVQNAVNLSGVTHAMSDAVHAVWKRAHSLDKPTVWVNRHPIVTLFLYKLVDLNATIIPTDYSTDTYAETNTKVAQLAAGLEVYGI